MPRSPIVLEALAPEDYLGADAIIQSDDPSVIALGRRLRAEYPADVDLARAAFEWVRDEVGHAYDVQDSRVTLTATEVLSERVGLCYAKSHLLTAILRSQGIPAGLCYQRLGSPDVGHALHGLVAIHLDGRWSRQDPRGNRPGVDAQFSVEEERLAYVIDERRGERDYPCVYPSPADEVVTALRAADDVLTCPLPSELPS